MPTPSTSLATAALRSYLQQRLLDDVRDRPAPPKRIVDWMTLAVAGPHTFEDQQGRSWFSYTATASVADVGQHLGGGERSQ